MRFGLKLPGGAGGSVGELSDLAAYAEQHGFDFVWIGTEPDGATADAAPLVTAAALAPTVPTLRIVVSVAVGDVNPIYVAEELAVADLVSNGRLVACACAAAGFADRFDEAVEILQRAAAPAAFRHEGPTWRIPANLPENVFNIEERLRVTPSPAQLELPFWLTGRGAFAVGESRGLTVVGSPDDSADSLATNWSQLQVRLGGAAVRLRRPRLTRLETDPLGWFDPDTVVAQLVAERAAWGLDTVVWALPPDASSSAWRRAVESLGRQVWPRVQLDRLPAGLEEEWRRREAGPVTHSAG